MTVLEAMACGAPVVVSKFAGIHEVLEDGRDCLIVDPNDADELSGAIVSLLRDRDLGARLGRAAAATVQGGFSWEAIARRHLEFYEKWM
jgi:glycosyltransferase involved in cell wall biosynthesis